MFKKYKREGAFSHGGNAPSLFTEQKEARTHLFTFSKINDIILTKHPMFGGI
jgi:hypothetical protein